MHGNAAARPVMVTLYPVRTGTRGGAGSDLPG
jgi:hypothetical protein